MRISVVIPAYNSATTVRDAIDSVLFQTHPANEIIVVDDGSYDDTPDIVRNYGERVILLSRANGGPGAARNRGIRHASGELVHFLDADDQWMPEKLARSLEALNAMPDAALVHTAFHYVAADGITLVEGAELPLLSGDCFCDLLRTNGNVILTSSVLARRELLLTEGGYRERVDFRCAEDWEFMLRLAAKYPFAVIEEPLVKYRISPGSLSSKSYDNAWGRLLAVQYTRQIERRRECMSDVDYDRMEAARWHALALAQWKTGKRRDARASFDRANSLTVEGRRMRDLYAMMSHILPVTSAYAVDRFLRRLRRTR